MKKIRTNDINLFSETPQLFYSRGGLRHFSILLFCLLIILIVAIIIKPKGILYDILCDYIWYKFVTLEYQEKKTPSVI